MNLNCWSTTPSMKTSKFLLCLLLLVGAASISTAQEKSVSEQMASTAMTSLWRDAGAPPRWTYEYGVVLKGLEGVWLSTGDGHYFSFIQKGLDNFVNADGTIRTYNAADYNLDNINTGRSLLLLYKVTGQDKYRKAAAVLREQLSTHPRTSDGGFWHKKIYPSQMWLDGLYMAEPFYAEYSATFHDDAAFDDIAKQFVLMERHSRDEKTGLLYHGWDESKQQRWADKATGHSPNFWDRAMGWYAMSLVDVLDYLPANHPKRAELIAILNRDVIAVEALEGTNAMIERAGSLCKVGGWTLIKVANKHQDMRMDVPTIGTVTIEKLAAARAGCVVLEAGKTVILEKQKVLELAERYKIAIVGFEAKNL